MRRLFYILILLSSIGYSQTPTLLGVHGSNSPQTLQNLGAQLARYGFTDYKIKEGINSGSTQVIDKARKLDSLNIKQVVFLTWPDTTSVNEYERIPTGIDSLEVFQYLDILLDSIGPHIEYIQISQEPFGASSYDPNEDFSDILNWWQSVAVFIRNKQQQNPSELGHLKLLTGGITGVNGAISNPNSQIAALIASLIEFGETYCDAIDVHLHLVDITMGVDIINYIKSKTNHPLTCTEWSQAKAAGVNGTNWINTVNTAFNSTHPFYGFTNKQVIDSAYVTKIDSSDWDLLIATSPHTTSFIYDFYSIMDSNCFELACYASPFQYGSPTYDWVQLYASKTVVQYMHPNNPFYQEYINLSNIIHSGQFNTNCSLLSIIDEENNYQKVQLYPNPFSDYATIEFENNNEIYSISIFNVLGEEVQILSNITSNKITINRKNLANGVYFYQLYSNNKIRSIGKFIIE